MVEIGEPHPDAYFIPAGSGSRKRLAPGVSIEASAGEGMMLSLVTVEPGAVVPLHSHHHEQMGMLISGRLEFTIGGVTRVVGPGDCWRIPGHVPHTATAIDGPAVALDVFHPVRDDYR